MTTILETKITYFNPPTSLLYKLGVKEGLDISSTGALLANSGIKTGRSPTDKRVVYDDNTKDIWWQSNHGPNIPLNKDLFNFYTMYGVEYLLKKDYIYQIDAYAGWDPVCQIKVRVYCTCAYHALFIKNMLIPAKEKFDKPDFTIYNVGDIGLKDATHKLLKEKPELEDTSLKNTIIGIDFTNMEMVIYGTKYAGEMKKGILTLMMYLMPLYGYLPLHSSGNIDLKPTKNKGSNLSLFFGLSGTGKTTLSADSHRKLIGDDEHVWTDCGISNVEGGCYAKCIGLNKNKEPEIFDAIRFGAVIENVVYDERYIVDYNNISITQNTRCSYPLNHIRNALKPAYIKKHPNNIIFLSCDAMGILPPVSKLTPEQAVYFFISGYTSKVVGTEMGVIEPEAVFSSCFGEPFLIWHPQKYGNLLKTKMENHGVNVWMLNTGWICGPSNTSTQDSTIGYRIPLQFTRAIINAIHGDNLGVSDDDFITLPVFDLKIPKECYGVEHWVLNPIEGWNKAGNQNYINFLIELRELFENNYKKYQTEF